MSFFKSINDYFRINFIGKPFELNKLVYDTNVILLDEKERNLIVRACRIFKGWQYLGQLLSFTLLYIGYSTSRSLKYNKRKQTGVVMLCFLPGVCCYIYSHFSYWHIIRDLLITTREREKKYSHLNADQIEEFQVLYNRSKDLHKDINSKIGFISSIFELFH